MVERILVPFEGDGSGVDGLGWGQQQLWQAMVETNSSMGMGAVVPAPPGRTAEDYAAELKFFMSRYQAMRTRLRFDADGRVSQVVSSSGEASVEVIDVDTDPAQAGEAVLARWRDTNYDYVNEWPMRMAVVRHLGVVTHVVVMLCHLAADGVGVGVMMRELSERDPETGQPKAPYDAMQPLDLVRWQRSPAAQRQTGAAMRFWETQLRSIPARRFGDPAESGEQRYWQICWSSPAMYMAVQTVAARANVDAAPVLLGAFAVGLARVTGANPFVAQAIVNNRFRPGLADVVTPLNQNGLCVIDVADITVVEAVDRARRASMSGSKYAYYDPATRDELITRICQERGEQIDLSCFFNDRRMQARQESPESLPTEDEVRAALPRSALLWETTLKTFNEKLMVNIDDVTDTVQITAEVDTHYLPLDDLKALMREMEAVAVEAAFDSNATTRVRSVQPQAS